MGGGARGAPVVQGWRAGAGQRPTSAQPSRTRAARARGAGRGRRSASRRGSPRPACRRAPGLRTRARDASATPRHVHNPQARPQRRESRGQVQRGDAGRTTGAPHVALHPACPRSRDFHCWRLTRTGSAWDRADRRLSVGSGFSWRRGRWSGRRSRRVRAAPSGAPSTVGCAQHRGVRTAPSAALPPHPTVLEATAGAGGTPRRAPGAARRRSVASDAHVALRPARLPACTRVRGSCRGFGCHAGGSGVMPGARGTGRGHCPRHDGKDPGHRGETPARGPRRPPMGGGFTWAHSWARSVDALPPHLWMRGGVTDVRRRRLGPGTTKARGAMIAARASWGEWAILGSNQ